MADNVIVVTEQAETLTVSESGTPGATGATGAAGQGVPTGGAAGQVLAKIDGANYNTEWVAQSGGGGSSAWGGITGTLSAQTDLQSALDAKALASRTVNGHALTADVTVSKSDLGLGSVDNTADTAKPVSTLQASADAAVLSSAQSYADGKVADNLTASTTVAPSKSAVNTAIGLKVTANVAITGATKTKVTYDASGLVISGADATTADIAESFNKRYITDAQQTVIGNTSGTNTGDNATNSQYSGLVSNATHTGDATGATALTVVGVNGVTLSGLATGIIKNTTGTGAPSIATYADLPQATRVVRSVSFGSGSFNTTLDVVDASITANDSIQTSIVSGSTMTAEEAAIQGVTVAAIINAGVGYTLHCAAPLGAIGIIGILTEKVGI